jgi:hypothetical protein
MTFQEAVESVAPIAASFSAGLQGLLANDRKWVAISDTRQLRGSVNLDAALRESRPNEQRWDYGIGLPAEDDADHALWVEVHSANALHIDAVVGKRRWLRQWLAAEAPALKQITPPQNYVWLATGSVALPRNSPQRKRLAVEGIQFRSQSLRLDEFLALRVWSRSPGASG